MSYRPTIHDLQARPAIGLVGEIGKGRAADGHVGRIGIGTIEIEQKLRQESGASRSSASFRRGQGQIVFELDGTLAAVSAKIVIQ